MLGAGSALTWPPGRRAQRSVDVLQAANSSRHSTAAVRETPTTGQVDVERRCGDQTIPRQSARPEACRTRSGA